MRYTGPKCRLCRREGIQLFLKGERCRTQKCSALRKNYPPGQHGKLFGKKSEFGKQLREKQKAKRMFGITEKVMGKNYRIAHNMLGDTSENLLKLLNVRFDNIIYMAGIANSRYSARQLISHGYFTINDRRAKSASIALKKGDKIALKKGKNNDNLFACLVKKKIIVPRWLKVDHKNVSCEMIDLPEGKELETSIDTQLIIGFYSR